MDIIFCILRWLHSLAKFVQLLYHIVKKVLCFDYPIFDQTGNIFLVIILKSVGSVFVNSIAEIAEKLLVVDYIAKILALIIQTIDATNRLKQPVVVHLLVDVQVRARWRVKPGQEFIHHDQKLHVGRFVDKLPLSFLFKRLNFLSVEHFLVDFVFFESFGVFFEADRIGAQISGLWLIRRDYGTIFEPLLLKDFVIFAGGVNRVGDKDCIAAAIPQTVLDLEVKDDVTGDFFQSAP